MICLSAPYAVQHESTSSSGKGGNVLRTSLSICNLIPSNLFAPPSLIPHPKQTHSCSKNTPQIRTVVAALNLLGYDGGANLSRKFSTLFISNFIFLIWTIDVDFSPKIPHPPLSRKFSTLNSSKRKRQGCQIGGGVKEIYVIKKGPRPNNKHFFF